MKTLKTTALSGMMTLNFLSAAWAIECKPAILGLAAANQQSERNPQMKAVGYYKSLPIEHPESLQDLNVPRPVAKPRDLVVRVKAISVNPVDAKQRRRSGSEDGTPKILGYDVAGIVEEVGEEVQNFKVGDEVFYAGSIIRPGSNSELHAVDERIVAKKPATLSFEQAASLPLTSLTAYEALFERLGLDPNGGSAGKSILIIGGAGGVGSMAIQLAKLAGLRVITTSSRAETTEWVKDLGADLVLNHREPLQPQLKAAGIDMVDTIFNTANTAEYWEQMADLIRPFGRIASIVESPTPLDLTRLMLKSASFGWVLMFTRSMFETPDMAKQSEILAQIKQWTDEKKIRHTMTETFTPIHAANLREAHKRLEGGRSIGKTVLSGW